MVYTHLPANALLALAAFMPSAPLAIACLVARMAFAQMDVPARQSLVMSLVPAEERPAAASVTNVPRSLASALPPLFAGALLERTSFGWPLVAAGLLKIAYDLLLLAQFRAVRTEKEGSADASTRGADRP
jgi:predicted MFS family arabinose efflux permease